MTFNLQAPPITPTNPTEARIAGLSPWFHNIVLPGGEQTAPNHPLGDFPRRKWAEIQGHIPRDLSGKTVLDIGCNAGFYCLELARRGGRVVGIDHDEHYLRQARWIAQQWGMEDRIEYRQLEIWDLVREHDGLPWSFDLILFMGVLYHLRHPLLALDIVALRTGGQMVFQTLTTADNLVTKTPPDLSLDERARLSEPGWPRMSFVEKSLASDQTNWWIPNASCCQAMLRSVGLRVVARPGDETYICTASHAGRGQRPAELPLELAALLGAPGAAHGRRSE